MALKKSKEKPKVRSDEFYIGFSFKKRETRANEYNSFSLVLNYLVSLNIDCCLKMDAPARDHNKIMNYKRNDYAYVFSLF